MDIERGRKAPDAIESGNIDPPAKLRGDPMAILAHYEALKPSPWTSTETDEDSKGDQQSNLEGLAEHEADGWPSDIGEVMRSRPRG